MIAKVVLLSALMAVALAGYHHEPEQHIEIHHPQPYAFGYHVKDKHGSKQFREETGNGHGGVKGSYGYTDPHGIYRKVDYVADKWGFRASVKTNEPGTANQNPAAVHMESNPIQVVYHEEPHHHGHEGGGGGGVSTVHHEGGHGLYGGHGY